MAGEVCADLLMVGPGANSYQGGTSSTGGPGGGVMCFCCNEFYVGTEYCVHIGQPATQNGVIDNTYINGGGVYLIAQGGAYRGGGNWMLRGSGTWRCSYSGVGQCSTAGGAGAGANTTTKTRCKGGPGGAGLCGYGGGGGGWGRDSGGTASDGGGAGAAGGGNGCPASDYGGGGGGSCVRVNAGCQGVVDICYPTDGTYGIHSATGGNCCYTCSGYCVHRFTCDGTFTIVS